MACTYSKAVKELPGDGGGAATATEGAGSGARGAGSAGGAGGAGQAEGKCARESPYEASVFSAPGDAFHMSASRCLDDL